MKKNIVILLGVILAVFCINFANSNNASALFYSKWSEPKDYNECDKQSGYRTYIQTVKNQCTDGSTYTGTNHCALWISSSDNPTEWMMFKAASAADPTAAGYLHGMCTHRTNTAVAIHVLKEGGVVLDGGAIVGTIIDDIFTNLPHTFDRGEWGTNYGRLINLNVAKFIQYGAQPSDSFVENGITYVIYSLNIVLTRCHKGNEGSCGYQDQVIKVKVPVGGYSAVSTASANSNSATTGIVGSSAQVEASVLNVAVGANVNINFSHNLYSGSKKTGQASWTVNRDFYMSLVGNSGPTSGRTAFTSQSDGKYIADTRNFNLNGTRYVSGGSYNVTFSQAGYYKFCESITIDSLTTQACVSVQVGTSCTGTDCECYGINCSDTTRPCDQNLPGSYTSSNSMGGSTSLLSVVRNLSLTNNYRNFQNTVYAKPTDTVNWCHAYYPGVQKAAEADVTHNNDHPEPDEGVYDSNTLYNHTFSGYSDWRNRFNITSNNVNPYYSYSASFSAGMSDPKEVRNNDRIELGQAGETLYEQISSDSPASAHASNGASHTWECHWEEDCDICGEYCASESTTESGGTVCDEYACEECYVDTCYHDNQFYYNTHGGTPSTQTSYVRVPYNFTNSAMVNISNSVAYAGETITIGNSSVTVSPKNNNTTQGNYATQVDSAKSKLIGYLSSSSGGSAIPDHGSSNICSAVSGRVKDGLCHELNSYTGETYNEDADMSGSTDELQFDDQTYNVYDAKAGDYYCVVVAIYPHTSGSETNLSVKGNDKWYVSAPSCRVIAKRPSFQVWGGSIYSEKSIQTSIAQKNNLKDIYGYTITSKGNTTIFGSWVEQSILANGIAKGIASGAATGDLPNAPYGGSKEGTGVNYCTYRVPLSLANYSSSAASGSICPSYQQTGNMGVKDVAIDRDAIIDYWNTTNTQYSNKSNINLTVDFLGTTDINGNPVRYTEVDSTVPQVNISGATIPKGITHIIRTMGNIMINGDLVYQSTSYRTQKDIPKLLIYSEKDITINCAVTRVDAILVAKGKVTTCNSTSYSSSTNSKQLVINGMVIADSMVLNRTYGAATGRNSSIPAEIINYDTSTFVWGKGMADSNDFEALTTVYQHEIAPRY